MNNLHQICKRCVMDTSDPAIIFDELGNCNHCNEFLSTSQDIVYHGEESDRQLEQILKRIKAEGKGKEYDCLIGMSGGVDSSYVTYKAVEYGLRPLAVHMDNGWNSEEAVKNIKNVCTKLNVDYQSYVLNWEQFKEIQLSILKSSIVEVEIPTDVAITRVCHKVASENNIKYIIGGGNYATEGILPNLWFYNPKDLKLLKSIHKEFASKGLSDFPTFDYKIEIYYKFIRRIKIVYLLNYLPFNKSKAISELEEKVGWKNYGGKHHESVYTRFVQSYLQPVKFDLDYRKATFSSQICNGEISREEALIDLKKVPFNQETLRSDKEYVSKKLGISYEDLENIIRAKPKSYKDYPNEEKKLEFLYSIYRKYFAKIMRVF
ncbi:MAG: N-acetyl sugar amidotransferase [SAR86 cluster bacterium]|nr:N-acetyl sugar amidotransferase [SAR86 cluster bacterium]